MKKERRETTFEISFLGDFLIGLCISYSLTITGVLLLAFMLLFFQISMELTDHLLNLLYLFSSFWGGHYLKVRRKKRVGLQGMLLGGCYYGIFLIISFFQEMQGDWKEGAFIILLSTILTAGLGSSLGKESRVNREKENSFS